jgi:hypothetical protein
VSLGGGAAILIFLIADAFVAPQVHDVHSPGGVPVKVTFFESNNTVAWVQSQPSQSLADMQCRLITGAAKCDASTLTAYFPNLVQTPQTLYLTWPHCVGGWGGGEVITWQGYSIDYVPSTRRLVIHCYRAKPWLYTPEYVYGLVALPRYLLASVSTTGMTAGTITIVEDDHLEHLVGDQTDEYQLATATIS